MGSSYITTIALTLSTESARLCEVSTLTKPPRSVKRRTLDTTETACELAAISCLYRPALLEPLKLCLWVPKLLWCLVVRLRKPLPVPGSSRVAVRSKARSLTMCRVNYSFTCVHTAYICMYECICLYICRLVLYIYICSIYDSTTWSYLVSENRQKCMGNTLCTQFVRTCVCVYIYIYICIYTCLYMYLYLYLFLSINKHTCIVFMHC